MRRDIPPSVHHRPVIVHDGPREGDQHERGQQAQDRADRHVTSVQSRSRQVAGSPRTQPQRRNAPVNRLDGLDDRDRYGAAIVTPDHSSAHRRCRSACRRTASRLLGASTTPSPVGSRTRQARETTSNGSPATAVSARIIPRRHVRRVRRTTHTMVSPTPIIAISAPIDTVSGAAPASPSRGGRPAFSLWAQTAVILSGANSPLRPSRAASPGAGGARPPARRSRGARVSPTPPTPSPGSRLADSRASMSRTGTSPSPSSTSCQPSSRPALGRPSLTWASRMRGPRLAHTSAARSPIRCG